MPAQGGDGILDTQLLHPAFTGSGGLSHPGALLDEQAFMQAGTVLQLEHAPLVFHEHGEDVASVVDVRFTSTFGAFVSPHRRLGVGLAFPLAAQQGAWEAYPLPEQAAGDLHLTTCWQAHGTPQLAVAVTGELFVPTSSGGSLLGESRVRGGGGVAVEGRHGRLRWYVAAGLLGRKTVDTGYNLTIGSQLGLTAGVAAQAVNDRLELFAELQGLGSAKQFVLPAAANPLDLRLGTHLTPPLPLRIDVAVGLGLNNGYGAADVRVLAGITALLPRPGRRPRLAEQAIDPIAPAPVEAAPPLTLTLPPPADPGQPPEEPVRAPYGPCRPLTEAVLFAKGSDQLEPAATVALEQVARTLAERPEIAHLVLEGHASAEGDGPTNWLLSSRRATAVYRFLVDADVTPHRLSVRGWGETTPHSGIKDDAVRARDRRVEFCVTHQLDFWKDAVPDWKAMESPVPWEGESDAAATPTGDERDAAGEES